MSKHNIDKRKGGCKLCNGITAASVYFMVASAYFVVFSAATAGNDVQVNSKVVHLTQEALMNKVEAVDNDE